ncbi:MAG: hypothetical protein AB1730_02860 [Myxococcota bacterium]|jgi:hypothetical protein
MDPFVRRLVERLFAPGHPLSRNRHFHTFENPEGRKALRIRRRLEGLAKDLSALREDGGVPSLTRTTDRDGVVTIALVLSGPGGTRTAYLDEDELELLLRVPGVPEALGRSEAV